VSYLPVSLDQYGRTVAACTAGGDWLASNGYALD
jgi:endonuclease YncB( thermonuclease family)